MYYYDNSSGDRDVDRYLRMKENMEDDLPFSLTIREAHADCNAIAEFAIGYPQNSPHSSHRSSPLVCIISATEEPILYSDNKMQISIKSPVGKFVSENLANLSIGMKLPNGAEILEIIHPKR